MCEGWELQQVCCTTWIHQHPMHIKTINTEGEYQCIIMRYNDPVRVNWSKGYGAICGLCFLAASCMDDIHPGLNRGRPVEFILLAL